MPTIIDGKATAAAIKKEIAEKVAARIAAGKRAPHLAAILVGHDGGSETYVAGKIKACAECGFRSSLIRLESTPEAPLDPAVLMSEIEKLNNDPEVDGFIVQLPLPKHIDEQAVIEASNHEPLPRHNISTRGKRVAIIGRSNIVGKPLANLLLQRGEQGDATVTVCHSATPDLAEITRQADIVVAALGRPGFVTADMVRDGAVIVDVGTTRVPDASKKSGFRLSGDVDYANVAPKCEAITPVPGGVGPMTITMLMANTLKAAEKRD